MRAEGNPLDLNNLPDDYSRDGKQVFEEGSSSGTQGYRKKKGGAKEGKEECGKVYECRFCSLKFCKSQALGGHMNRHRQERETETLNRARQLVFSNDNLAAQGAPHLGCCHPISAPSGYQHTTGNVGDPTLPHLRFSTRMFSANSSAINIPPPPQQQQPPLYTSHARPTAVSFSSQHYPHQQQHDYYVGHPSSLSYGAAVESGSYTCIGAPVGHGLIGGRTEHHRDGSLHPQEEGLNWGRSYSAAPQHQPPPAAAAAASINRFQDGF